MEEEIQNQSLNQEVKYTENQYIDTEQSQEDTNIQVSDFTEELEKTLIKEKSEQESYLENQKKWDTQVGIFVLYDQETIEKLLRCYPIWDEMPQKEEIQLMVNGGCIYYKYKIEPYVYGLDLKDENEKFKELSETEWNQYIKWFARFADLVLRGNYKQQWYRNIFEKLQIDPQCQYVKSFFGILANLAFLVENEEDCEFKTKLGNTFKQILELEANRDYKQEIEILEKNIEQLLKQQNEQKTSQE